MTSSDVLPQQFVERLREIAQGVDQVTLLRGFEGGRAATFRANGLKADVSTVRKELVSEGLSLQPIPWVADAFAVPSTQRAKLTHSAASKEGRIYIQNPSSMIPPLTLEPEPTEWILDLAAAPGGKTVQLAGMMGNDGRISAVESVRSRFFRLVRVLDLYGVANTKTYLKDGRRVWRSCPEQFDRVLLDAPCSAEGRFHMDDPTSFAYWSLRKIREMKRLQKRLMYSAVQALRPGGILVYSTCTFAPEENELIVEAALEQFPDALEIEPTPLTPATLGAVPALMEWQGTELHPNMGRCVRVLPKGGMEGFFVARLRKIASTAPAARLRIR